MAKTRLKHGVRHDPDGAQQTCKGEREIETGDQEGQEGSEEAAEPIVHRVPGEEEARACPLPLGTRGGHAGDHRWNGGRRQGLLRGPAWLGPLRGAGDHRWNRWGLQEAPRLRRRNAANGGSRGLGERGVAGRCRKERRARSYADAGTSNSSTDLRYTMPRSRSPARMNSVHAAFCPNRSGAITPGSVQRPAASMRTAVVAV